MPSVSEDRGVIEIIGQGLAGSCLAWQLWFAGERDFCLIDRARRQGSSDAAAGMINPITGKGWNPSVNIESALPVAREFYDKVSELTGQEFFQNLPIRRWIDGEKEAVKVAEKLERDDVRRWVDTESSDPRLFLDIEGGGRVFVTRFLDATREFFANEGRMRVVDEHWSSPAASAVTVLAQGAEGLMNGASPYSQSHRCAKGEILRVKFASDGPDGIEIRRGKWMIPDGDRHYLVGATYEWDKLDRQPTTEAKKLLEAWIREFYSDRFEVVEHRAGIRPIIRQSEPVFEQTGERRWIFNGLGSKGGLYAPLAAARAIDRLR